MYVGATDLKKLPSPARLAGLKSGDIIRTVDGQTVSDTQSLGERLAAGKAVKLGVRRGERELTFDVQPQRDERDGVYRIGAWVREGAAGIGTLTYVDPETGVYGALGHPINDSDSGVSIPVREGVLYEGELTGVVRGRRGVPGALEGEIVEQAPLGTIEWNDDTGIGADCDGGRKRPEAVRHRYSARGRERRYADVPDSRDGRSASEDHRRYRAGHERQSRDSERQADRRGNARAGGRSHKGLCRGH